MFALKLCSRSMKTPSITPRTTMLPPSPPQPQACLSMSISAPLCLVFPSSCLSCIRSCISLSPVNPAAALPTAPLNRSPTPLPKSLNCPFASWPWPCRFCSLPSRFRLSLPSRLPRVSLPEPRVWSHEPWVRSALSLAAAPEEPRVMGPTLRADWEAVCSVVARSRVWSALACGEGVGD